MTAVITDPAVQLVAIGVLLIWVIALTVVLVMRRRQPWRDDGQPVFKKLPNGRIQFSWGVAQGLWQAERRHHDQANSPSADSRENQGLPVAALLAREGHSWRFQDDNTAPIPPEEKWISHQPTERRSTWQP